MIEQENNITRAEEYHQRAMDLAEEAFLAKRRGEQVDELLRQAFEYERHAANIVESDRNLEPSRSVLHRSAASLALDCGELRAAEQLICTALSGNPPEEIARELRDLLKQVYVRWATASKPS